MFRIPHHRADSPSQSGKADAPTVLVGPCMYGATSARPTASRDLIGLLFFDTTLSILYQCQMEAAGSPSWNQLTQQVISGTYTPTLTGDANVSSSTAFVCQYSRVGSLVTVSGKCEVTTTDALPTQLGISLPIASNFAQNYQAAGTSQADLAGTAVAGKVISDASNNRAELQFMGATTTLHTFWFQFSYQII